MANDAEQPLAVENPATLEQIEVIRPATVADLEQAVENAARARAEWTATPLTRPHCLRAIADGIESASEELALLLTMEQGKPITQARLEVAVAANAFRYYASLSLKPQIVKSTPGQQVEKHYHPFGVVGLITAWNFPLALLAWKTAPAIMAGNAAIVKPAPTTPLTALRLQEIFDKILPDGLVTVLVGDTRLGEAMVRHPRIEKISFTGSTATGRRIMEAASARIKRLTLELGGNDPAILLPDADVSGAVEGVAAVAFRNAGQVCIAPKRVYVHRSRYDEAVDAFRAYLDRQRVGDGQHEDVTIGPVNNDRQRTWLQDLTASVARDGGTLHVSTADTDLPGYFVRPAVVTGLGGEARLVTEEQFGPLLPILPYDEVDEAVTAANATDYGLGASVWGPDTDAAREVAARVRSGTRWVNQHGPAELDVPFGGVNQSGLGTELGQEGLDAFAESRVTNVRL
ncbi:aldehyde dehydrogenase family protein [Streptomyces hirsutus]|uniref:aldehyde dehydrogenase family protein n=1 Tax=Streptomyces hirsutus TaxID=35620 RepID=UPI0036678E39